MIMYYFYERVWTSLKWGRVGADDADRPMTLGEVVLWTLAIVAVVAVIFAAIIYLGPLMKAK